MSTLVPLWIFKLEVSKAANKC